MDAVAITYGPGPNLNACEPPGALPVASIIALSSAGRSPEEIDPKKEKGYYGATVAAPIFKEIAQKIYTTTPIDNQSVSDEVDFTSIEKQYDKYNIKLNKEYKRIPNVYGMIGMDALSLLENIGLKVKLSGMGRVKSQSLKKGVRFTKGSTIILKLS